MIDRATKLRMRRRFKRRQRAVEDMGLQAEANIEKMFFKRLYRLSDVRRFVVSWLLLFFLLISGVIVQTRSLASLYQQTGPIPGGTYTEGILGTFTNANPLYATGSVDGAVSQLVFSGLMRYDDKNRLVNDLAERLEVDASGQTYTLTLRPDLKWHDGAPLTSEDVVFTYRTIQNPDAKSPLNASWQGIKVEAVDERTVKFTLPNTLSSFPHSLTNGIVPKHLLEGVEPTQLRSVGFNTKPIGAGPFKWEALEVSGGTPADRQEQIGLLPFEDFHRGQPKLQRFIIRTFRDEDKLLTGLTNQELTAIAGLQSLPDNLEAGEYVDYNIPLTGQVMAFFKTTQEPLTDIAVRQALVRSVDQVGLIKNFDYPVIASRAPLLETHLGYDKNRLQQPYNIEEAKKQLDAAGWLVGKDGIRFKNGQPLTLRLLSQSTSEYTFVTGELQKQWRQLGVDTKVILQSASDLQSAISQHNYDILLYGISLGTDPDVFPYWHSSQAQPRTGGGLNLSEYRSTPADKALEAGRTRSDQSVRAAKYHPFLDAWRNDAPALALYQPRFLYVSRLPIANFEPKEINTAADRYANIENWMIRDGKVVREE